MEPPVCKLCLQKHWPKENCRWQPVAPKKTPPEVLVGRAEHNRAAELTQIAKHRKLTCTGCVDRQAEIDELRAKVTTLEIEIAALVSGKQPAGKFDKKAYQRNYMRTRREKGNGHGKGQE